jgi:hypothetical protein
LCFTGGLEYSNAFLVADFHAFRVAIKLPCSRCRYDLRGLAADAKCPECGLEVLETVAARVDPELALMPSLEAPRLAGTSLLFVALGIACAAIGTSASAAALILSRLPRVGWHTSLLGLFPPTVPERLFLVSPIALVVASFSSLLLFKAAGVTSPRRFLLAGGLLAWTVASWFRPELLHLALTGILAMVTLVGLGPFISELGQRSRVYRHASHARQAVGPLTLALAIGVLAVLSGDLGRGLLDADLVHLLKLIATVCLAMANVGVLYLVGNAGWIWRSLWVWQPLLERVLVTTPKP